MTKLFISGFPLEIEDLELVKIVALHGEVSTVKIVRDKATGKCKGYAFLEMVSLEAAENAIQILNGTPMGKKNLFLNIVGEKSGQIPVSKPITVSPAGFRDKKPQKEVEIQKKKRPRLRLDK
jgi:RNA recognition motif-containing protein